MLQTNNLHQLCETDPETGELLEPLCEEVTVLKKKEDLLTGEILLEVGLWRRGKLKTFDLERASLCGKHFISKLMAQGLSLADDKNSVDAVGEYLLMSEQDAPDVSVHSTLGFTDLHGQLIYLADAVVGGASNSTFHDPVITAPKGTLNSWKGLIEAEVLGRDNLELALAIGASSPVVHLMRKNGLYTENPVWALIGQSSTGKTTALRLMASVFGNPSEDNGIIHDLHTTENALFETLSKQNGWAMLIDEATSQPKWDFSSIVYNLSKGKDKNRCSRSGKAYKPKTFSGTIVISGESSLAEQSRPTLGMYARMAELTLDWTDDADHSHRLSEGCFKNYGTAIVPIAETLLLWQKDKPGIFEREFEKEIERLRTAIGTVPGTEERLLNMYATTIFSAKMIKKTLGIRLNIEKMRNLLISIHHKAPKQCTIAQRLYDAITDEITTHSSYFPAAASKNMSIMLSDMWGERSSIGGKTVVWITQQTFESFAQKCNFSNYKGYLTELCNQGFLVRFGDRYLQDHKLGNSYTKCYCLIAEATT